MASAKEIDKELAIALKEVGKIKPKFDKKTNDWGFSHKAYPVECGGSTPEEVIKNYPLYLREFIRHRVEGNLDPLIEKRTKGHGGRREGAGRPRGTAGEHKVRIYLREDLAMWLKNKENMDRVRKMMNRTCCA